MRRFLPILPVLALLLVLSPAAPAAAAGIGFLELCPYHHSLADDPIVFPNQPGASHLHDFFGAKDANAASTLKTMRAGGTTCEAADTAGYWVPALYENGNRVLAQGSFGGRSVREQFYYRDDNLAAGTTITPFPPGFKAVIGNHAATSISDNPELGDNIYWGCSDNNGPPGKQTTPPDCAVGILTLHLQFPNCWDGAHLNTVKNPGSLVYPSNGHCPSADPVAVPRLIERFEWPVGTTTGTITLSSGPSYTAHADFWNTWHQKPFAKLVNDCLNADVACGEFSA